MNSATPQTAQNTSGRVSGQVLAVTPSMATRRMYMPAAEVISTDTSTAGTTASIGGTRRPRRPIIQRGNTSPQRWTRPSVSTAPSAPKVPSAAPANHRPVSCPSR